MCEETFMILFENVTAEYDKGFPVLSELSFAIEDGENVGLIGANGAGKSTIMKAMLGIISHSGIIKVDNCPVDKSNLADIRKKMGLVLQNSDNQMFMPTVYEDIMFGPLNYGVARGEVEKIINDVLFKLEITDLKMKHNHKLSGGEKRMAAIATVLAMEPSIILMDEPTSALDPYNRRKVINIINSLDGTMIIASHDLDMILDTCSRVILLSDGKIIADGDAKMILKDKKLLEDNRMELPLRYQ